MNNTSTNINNNTSTNINTNTNTNINTNTNTLPDLTSLPLKATVSWQDEFHFLGTAPSGNHVPMDANKTRGASPMELILLGLGGCASYDVVSILQKARQNVQDVRCELSAKRADVVPAVYTDIHLHFVVTGEGIKDKQVAKAVELSAQKYCSASRMLEQGGVSITHDYCIESISA